MLPTIAVVLGVLALSFLMLYRAGVKKRLNLAAYAAYLLLSDEIREGHKAKLIGFIKDQTDEQIRGGGKTLKAIEGIADELGRKNSLLAAHQMILKAHSS